MKRPVLPAIFNRGDSGLNVPERVRETIANQEDASERLIAWVQFGVVLIFGALYAISPKTSTVVPWQTPVGIALAVYFVFSVFRIWLSYRIRLPGWFLALSVVADLSLLLTVIWSFHIQYDQPASFYLKAPTLLYVFIFIVLRALRFEARYVILAGLVAAGGWLLMVGYVITVDPHDNMITRDYVAYMTSNAILLGAEFDKIISILIVTAILSVALYRARRLLERSVIEAAAAKDLARFFSPEIADKITHSATRIRPGQGEAREAAILMTDIRGFTALSNELAPSDLIALLTEYESRMVPVIQAHGGNIDKFLGDGILATFGAVLPSDTYAADAMRAVDDLHKAFIVWRADRVAAGRKPVEIGMAVVTGRIVFGAVGDETRLEYTVIGDPVNLCAKLEKHNRSARTTALTTGESYALAQSQGYTPPAPCLARRAEGIAGVENPVDTVVLVGR
ncbi:MAG: adenylate/guanylate cyclase domain-containing protein [Alphaproteobacteria bacterium]